eukprot:3074318-Rhodomonas_salina.1
MQRLVDDILAPACQTIAHGPPPGLVVCVRARDLCACDTEREHRGGRGGAVWSVTCQWVEGGGRVGAHFPPGRPTPPERISLPHALPRLVPCVTLSLRPSLCLRVWTGLVLIPSSSSSSAIWGL